MSTLPKPGEILEVLRRRFGHVHTFVDVMDTRNTPIAPGPLSDNNRMTLATVRGQRGVTPRAALSFISVFAPGFVEKFGTCDFDRLVFIDRKTLEKAAPESHAALLGAILDNRPHYEEVYRASQVWDKQPVLKPLPDERPVQAMQFALWATYRSPLQGNMMGMKSAPQAVMSCAVISYYDTDSAEAAANMGEALQEAVREYYEYVERERERVRLDQQAQVQKVSYNPLVGGIEPGPLVQYEKFLNDIRNAGMGNLLNPSIFNKKP